MARRPAAADSSDPQELLAVVRSLRRQLAQREQQNTKQSETIAALTEQIAELSRNLANVSEQLREMQRLLFGRRSEKLPSIASEIRRVISADELTVEGKKMPSDPKAKRHEKARVARKKSEPFRQVRRKLKRNLPVLHERVDVLPNDFPPGSDPHDFREIGSGEPIRRIEHVREHLVVVEYTLQTLVSRHDETIVKAKAPLGVAEGCGYGPGLHAHVVVAKCADSIPFHRLTKMLERAGMPVARSTIGSLFHRTALILYPIHQRIVAEARHDPYLHADETSLGVLAKEQCLKGWIWGLMSLRALAYVFAESRRGEVARQLIGDTTGYLTVDGYSGYNELAEHKSQRNRVGCWSHARRKFYAALKSEPRVKEVLKLVVELYLLERRAVIDGIQGTADHLELRNAKALSSFRKSNNGWMPNAKAIRQEA